MANEKRLIDANALMERLKFKRRISERGLHRGLESAMAQVAKAQTVDAVEVVHGKWDAQYECDFQTGVQSIAGYTCNRCGLWNLKSSNYCPNCGADMRGETE